MKFLFTISFLFSVAFAQIKADGKTNDLPALKEWAKAGGTLPSGTIRITDTWAIGDEIFAVEEMLNKSPKLDLKKYQTAKFAKAIQIAGNNTTIWLDNPDTTKPVIAYNAQGLLQDNNAGLISGLTLKGVGIGIISSFTKGLRIYNVNFKGFKTGLMLNNSSFFDCQNLRFENCERAEYDIRCHRSKFSNIIIGNCKKGFEIRSNKIKVDGYYASFCNVGLHAAAGDNIFDNVYLETTLPAAKGEAQLMIGDKTGSMVDCNVFTSLTVSAPDMVGIAFLPTSRETVFIGCRMESQSFDVQGKPLVTAIACKGQLPKEIIKL